jgi:hypothetical protein
MLYICEKLCYHFLNFRCLLLLFHMAAKDCVIICMLKFVFYVLGGGGDKRQYFDRFYKNAEFSHAVSSVRFVDLAHHRRLRNKWQTRECARFDSEAHLQ